MGKEILKMYKRSTVDAPRCITLPTLPESMVKRMISAKVKLHSTPILSIILFSVVSGPDRYMRAS